MSVHGSRSGGIAAAPAEEIDVVVVGAGLTGAAVAWAVGRAGQSVTVLGCPDAAGPDGRHEGDGRWVARGEPNEPGVREPAGLLGLRRAFADPELVRLSGRALRWWRQAEHESGAALLRLTGGVDHGLTGEPVRLARALAEAGVPHELLSSALAERRWPGLRFTGPVLYHPQAGRVHAARAADALLRAAARSGAHVHRTATVGPWECTGSGVSLTVREDGRERRLRARRVVLATAAAFEGEEWEEERTEPAWVYRFARGTGRGGAWAAGQGALGEEDFGAGGTGPGTRPVPAPWPSVVHHDRWQVHSLGERAVAAAGAAEVHTLVLRGTGRPGVPGPESAAAVTAYVREWLPGLDADPLAARRLGAIGPRGPRLPPLAGAPDDGWTPQAAERAGAADGASAGSAGRSPGTAAVALLPVRQGPLVRCPLAAPGGFGAEATFAPLIGVWAAALTRAADGVADGRGEAGVDGDGPAGAAASGPVRSCSGAAS